MSLIIDNDGTISIYQGDSGKQKVILFILQFRTQNEILSETSCKFR